MPRKHVFCVYIRALPNGLPFYVGKASDLNRPYRVECKYRNLRHQAIVRKHGAKNIAVRIIKCASEAEAFEREVSIIATLRALGMPLTNIASGGSGCLGFKQSDKQKAQTSLVHKGKVLSAETRLKISKAKTGAKLSAERVEQMRISGTGRKLSTEAKLKISLFHKAYRHTPGTLAKMAAARVDRKLSEDHKRKIGTAHRGRTLTAEHRAKIGQGNRGKTRTPEQREELSKAHLKKGVK